MNAALNPRTRGLLAALLATLAATWWAASLDEEPVMPVAERSARPAPGQAPRPAGARARVAAPAAATAAATVASDATPALQRPRWPDGGARLIAVPPPPPPLVADPVAAAAPPLPFRFVGAVEAQGRRSVVLLEGDTVHVLRAGERIDDRYRIDRITPTGVELTYLPLRERQLLDTAAHEPNR